MDTKRCSRCKSVKPTSEFYKNSGTKDGLQYNCIPCRKEYNQQPEVKERKRERSQQPEVKAYAKAYAQTPNGKASLANAAARYYGRNGRVSRWNAEDIRQQYIDQLGHCLGCYQAFDLKDLECDHDLPRCRNGQETFDNLLLLCRSCNASKGKRTFAEWQVWKGVSQGVQGYCAGW